MSKKLTPRERAATARRMKEYRQRQKDAGLKSCVHWLDDAENGRIKQVVARWRGETGDLNDDEAAAAELLKP